MYSLPQEIEVWYIIPAIRKELAKFLTKEHNLTFEKTGQILGISKSAVSQYLSNKRAGKLKLPEKIKDEIKKSSRIIVDENNSSVAEMERILRIIRTNKCSCDVCRKYNPEIIKYCNCKPVC